MWHADIVAAAGFLSRLPRFLRRPLSVAAAEAEVAARLARRGDDFLAGLRTRVFAFPRSPYHALFGAAGCAYDDAARLVQRDGLEAALRALARAGIYLTVDELKGRTPAVRGSARIAVDPGALRNSAARGPLAGQTSGSGGARTAVPIDLGYVRDCAADSAVMLAARGGAAWDKGHWAPLGGGALMSLLQFSAFGAPSVRWFSQVDPGDAALHPRYRWSARCAVAVSRLAGRPLPAPRFAPLDAPLPVVEWLRESLRAGRTPHLLTYPSSAARLGDTACARGIDLAGAQITVSGEPVTEARLAALRRAGAVVVPRYGTAETGPIGLGCLAAGAPDEVHLLTDLHAVVQLPAGEGPALPPGALFLTSLRPTSPFVLLNVSLGDEAVLDARRCGCALEGRGWTTHLHRIRSFEKLTVAGMTLLDMDVLPLLDTLLPARFGGSGLDYQLVEHEAVDGAPRLQLVVDPAVGPLDEAALVEVLLAAIEAQSPAGRVAARLFRQAGVLQVLRQPPGRSASGKVLHLLRRPRP